MCQFSLRNPKIDASSHFRAFIFCQGCNPPPREKGHWNPLSDFIPQFFASFFAELAAKVAILILRFENASDCDCDFLGR